ncbi:inosine uridine-preferring nucleoside hydrolase [Diplodia corticola]|uniref:Inosine uridine-preferring nucleoside hydrolase n=1 Tax=Diplodia corticola TaxID=236234 RepID=A0A1J9R981_9PEZI|nr:inosine uridine-preferring nucleoside hydrolase [Diplodia corticola]OJD38102.1 inosine uridine-preferring nucleoside hydrolase [Diplodia corticola]
MCRSGFLRCLLRLALASLPLAAAATPAKKKLVIDTDLFSDVDDTTALLLAATSTNANLLAVNVNYPSSYSALAASAILAHYGHPDIPIGVVRPLTNASFFDQLYFEHGEYASKVAYHWSAGSLPWGDADRAWDPVSLYRKVLAEQEDESVTIVSVGFFENLSGLLNSTADGHSSSSGLELVQTKVSELVIMGGGYPSGFEFNFHGSNSSLTAHVVNNWPGKMTFSGSELGGNVSSGATLTVKAPAGDPAAAAYRWYTGYNVSRFSWDPLTVLYACDGLGHLFEYANEFGYNYVHPNGSNDWVYDETATKQHWLQLKVDNETAARELDRRFLEGAVTASYERK